MSNEFEIPKDTTAAEAAGIKPMGVVNKKKVQNLKVERLK